MRQKIQLTHLALAAIVVAAAGCSEAQSGADSPEAALAAAQQASANNDAEAIIRLVAPSEIPLMAVETDAVIGLMIAFSSMEDEAGAAEGAKLAQEAAELRKEYNFYPELEEEGGDEALQAREYCTDVDCTGYLIELATLLFATMPPSPDDSMFPSGEAGEIQQQGDRATVQVGTDKIEFVREQGRWYLAEPPG